MKKQFLSAVLSVGMALSLVTVNAGAAAVKPAKAPVVHYDFSNISDDSIVANIAASEDAEDSCDAVLVNNPVINSDEGYVSTNGAALNGNKVEGSYISLPKQVFTNMESGEFSLTMYVRAASDVTGQANATIFSVGNEGGGHGNYYTVRAHENEGAERGSCIRLNAKANDGGGQSCHASFSEKPNAQIKTDEWQLLTITHSTDGTFKMYMNEEEIVSASIDYNLAGASFDSQYVMALGQCFSLSDGGFAGDFSDVRIYDYALTADEIAGVIYDIQGKFATGVTLDKSRLTLTVGETAELTASVTPDTAENKTVTFSSSDDSVASVDESGKVTAIKAGTATITAAIEGFTAACEVTVSAKQEINNPEPTTPDDKKPDNKVPVAVTGITASKKSVKLTVGGKAVVTAAVTPSNATDKTVAWKSSNPSVVSVNGGKLIAKKPGKATVTAVAGGKAVSIAVKVAPAQVKKVKAVAKKRKAVIKFKAVKGAAKYQIVAKKGKKTAKKFVSKSGKSIKLKAGKYKIKVRAYGGGVYGKYSNVVTVKVK